MVFDRSCLFGWARHSAVRAGPAEGTIEMQIIATHEVDDVEHWFNSPKRAELFEQSGIRVTPFRTPDGNGVVTAVLIDTPDMETFQAALETDEAQEAMEYDGVHPDTIKLFVDG